MIPLRALVAVVVLLAAPALARAQGAPAATRSAVGVMYTRGPGTEGCPDETGLRESITGRVGSAVKILGSTASVPTKIGVTITHEQRLFVSRWDWIDGDDPRVLKDENCYRLVERTAVSIAIEVKPIPAPAPPLETEPAPLSDVAPSAPPPPPPPPSSPAPPAAPPPPPRSGVFDGRAGIGRIAGLAVAGTGTAIGAGFSFAALTKQGNASAQLDKLVQMSGTSEPCFGTSSSFSKPCASIAAQRQAADTNFDAAEIAFIVAGAVGVATVASAFLVRTPAAPARLTVAAGARSLDITVGGAW